MRRSAATTLAPRGGGLHNLLGSATLTNVTIIANSSGLAGAGISNSGGTMRLENTLVANASLPADQDCFGTITSAGGNLDSGTSCGFSTLTDISNTDPLLGPRSRCQGSDGTDNICCRTRTGQQRCPIQRLTSGNGCDHGADNECCPMSSSS